MNYVKGHSIFTDLTKVPKQYPYLTEDIETDVAIIGGGVTGAILGYYFTQNNTNAVVLEKGRIAHCSTSITTSLLQYELDSNEAKLREVTNTKNTIEAYKQGLKALDLIDTFIKQHGNNCDFKRTDCLLYTTKKLEDKEIEQEYNIRLTNGLDVKLIDNDSNPYGFDISKGIISKKGGAVFDPYKYTHCLLNESVKNGLRVYENSEVVGIKYNENDVLIDTVYGNKIKAKKAIVATGYNTDAFTNREFGTKSTAFNVATTPIYNLDEIYKNTVFRDNMDVYHYFRATADNRLIMGGEDINFYPDIDNDKLCENSYDLLTQKLKTMFPQYEFDIDYKYCGAFASTRDNLGFVGEDLKHKNLWFNLGYGANGILFAILGAQILVDKYNGKQNKNASLFDMSRPSK